MNTTTGDTDLLANLKGKLRLIQQSFVNEYLLQKSRNLANHSLPLSALAIPCPTRVKPAAAHHSSGTSS